MLAYYGTRLSPHIDRTPEGYLICRDVPIARTGPQVYLARELGLDGDPDRAVTVNRYPEDVFDPAVLASFEGKDVTAGHPPENVGPENHAAYSKGHVQNVRHSGDHIIADLIVKDANLVSDVWNGVTREVSCGYMCQYVPDGGGYKQQQIRGNHVAVVPRGRAGHEVAIHDSAATAGKGNETMNEEETKTQTAPESEPEKKETPAQEPAKAESKPAADAAPSPLEAKLDRLIGLLEARDSKPEDPAGPLDQMITELEGGGVGNAPAVTEVPTRDAALSMLKAMRPAVAGIKDEQDRARVVDALLSTVKGPNMVGQVVQAVQANAQQAADAAQASTFEARCRESEAAYAARNPHKKKED